MAWRAQGEPSRRVQAGQCLPRPHGTPAAMIMAECLKGMAHQIRNATFTLVDRGSWP
jgi:hypothetical protein